MPGIGEVTSAASLGAGLSRLEEFRTCFVRRVAHYLLGSDLGENSGWRAVAHEEFVHADLDIGALVASLVAHPGFIERVVEGESHRA